MGIGGIVEKHRQCGNGVQQHPGRNDDKVRLAVGLATPGTVNQYHVEVAFGRRRRLLGGFHQRHREEFQRKTGLLPEFLQLAGNPVFFVRASSSF